MNLQGKKAILHDMSLRDGMHAKRHQISLDEMVAVATARLGAGLPIIVVTPGDGLGGAGAKGDEQRRAGEGGGIAGAQRDGEGLGAVAGAAKLGGEGFGGFAEGAAFFRQHENDPRRPGRQPSMLTSRCAVPAVKMPAGR